MMMPLNVYDVQLIGKMLGSKSASFNDNCYWLPTNPEETRKPEFVNETIFNERVSSILSLAEKCDNLSTNI